MGPVGVETDCCSAEALSLFSIVQDPPPGNPPPDVQIWLPGGLMEYDWDDKELWRYATDRSS